MPDPRVGVSWAGQRGRLGPGGEQLGRLSPGNYFKGRLISVCSDAIGRADSGDSRGLFFFPACSALAAAFGEENKLSGLSGGMRPGAGAARGDGLGAAPVAVSTPSHACEGCRGLSSLVSTARRSPGTGVLPQPRVKRFLGARHSWKGLTATPGVLAEGGDKKTKTQGKRGS